MHLTSTFGEDDARDLLRGQMKNLWYLILLALAVSTLSGSAATAYTFTSLDAPNSSNTVVRGVRDGTVVGYYVTDTTYLIHGFSFNGTSYTVLDHPMGSDGTYANGIAGGVVVGSYYTSGDPHSIAHGFTYNGASYTTTDRPSSFATSLEAIWGNTIVGYNETETSHTGFIYDGTTWTTLAHPDEPSLTAPHGIFGSSIVGTYGGLHGFLYDGSTWSSIDYPGATETQAYGIFGSSIVGYYLDSGGYSGFLYNGSTYTTIDYPGATETLIFAIDGYTMVGAYRDIGGAYHGFIAVPEPASVALFGLLLSAPRRRRRAA